jgi:hypothetical protein
MPLMYGEGEKAFVRLQEEIMKVTDDHSILAWGINKPTDRTSDGIPEQTNYWTCKCDLLAVSPLSFKNCGNMHRGFHSLGSFVMTNRGLNIRLPLVSMPLNRNGLRIFVGILNCVDYDPEPSMTAILLREDEMDRNRIMTRIIWDSSFDPSSTMITNARLASKCDVQDIIIGSPENINSGFPFQILCQGYVVRMSQLLRTMDYGIIRGKGWAVHGSGPSPFFDAMGDESCTLDPSCFTFDWSSSTLCLLSVLIVSNDIQLIIFMAPNTRRQMIRKGSAFPQSHSELLDIWEYLATHADTGGITITDTDGEKFEITVSSKSKFVYDWNLFDIDVDAVPVDW